MQCCCAYELSHLLLFAVHAVQRLVRWPSLTQQTLSGQVAIFDITNTLCFVLLSVLCRGWSGCHL